MPTPCVNIRYLIIPDMSPTDISPRYYARLRKYHLEKNAQLADGREYRVHRGRPYAHMLAAFKTAHMQYIDDCDYLWELANVHSHLARISSPDLAQIFGWVLGTFVVLVMHFCRNNAAAMVQERLLPIYTGDPSSVWSSVVQPMPSAAMAGSDRETLRRNALPKLRERLGDGPELLEQWDRVNQFFTAAIWLQLRVTRSPIFNTIPRGLNGAGTTGESPQQQPDPWAIGQLELDEP